MLLRICQSLVLHCLVVLHFWHGCLFISATVPIKENILSNASTAQGQSVMSCSMINLVYINNNCYHGVITNCNCCTSGHNREVINLVVTLTLCHCVWYIIIKTLFNFNIYLYCVCLDVVLQFHHNSHASIVCKSSSMIHRTPTKPILFL